MTIEVVDTKLEALKLITDPSRLFALLFSKYGDIQDDYYMMLNERDDSFDGRYIGPTKQDYLVQEVWLLVNRDYLFEKQKALFLNIYGEPASPSSFGVCLSL